MKRLLLVLVLCFVPSAVSAQTSYLTIFARSQNSEPLIQRVQVALTSAAVAIANEAPSVVQHQARAAYALAVVADSRLQAIRAMLVLLSDGVDYGAATDAVLQTRVNAVWNLLAGITN